MKIPAENQQVQAPSIAGAGSGNRADVALWDPVLVKCDSQLRKSGVCDGGCDWKENCISGFALQDPGITTMAEDEQAGKTVPQPATKDTPIIGWTKRALILYEQEVSA